MAIIILVCCECGKELDWDERSNKVCPSICPDCGAELVEEGPDNRPLDLCTPGYSHACGYHD